MQYYIKFTNSNLQTKNYSDIFFFQQIRTRLSGLKLTNVVSDALCQRQDSTIHLLSLLTKDLGVSTVIINLPAVDHAVGISKSKPDQSFTTGNANFVCIYTHTPP